MTHNFRRSDGGWFRVAHLMAASCALLAFAAASLWAQRDPAEPAGGKAEAELLARPAGAIARADVDNVGMRTLVEQLVTSRQVTESCNARATDTLPFRLRSAWKNGTLQKAVPRHQG